MTERRGPVTVLTLNRPEVHNCIDGETAEGIATTIIDFREDEQARVLVVTGAGSSFSSGADLRRTATLRTHPYYEEAGPLGFARLDPDKPTIAAIEGYCLAGGLELAAWCDFRIASRGARFGGLNRRWGISFVDGGTQRLARIVGLGNALWLILSGVMVDAERAQKIGFVQEVVPGGGALTRALELAEHVASYPQGSLRADRAALLGGLGTPLEDGLALEARLGGATLGSEESQRRLDEFDKKTRPEPPRPAD